MERKYRKMEKLGQGTYGVVYKAEQLTGPDKGRARACGGGLWRAGCACTCPPSCSKPRAIAVCHAPCAVGPRLAELLPCAVPCWVPCVPPSTVGLGCDTTAWQCRAAPRFERKAKGGGWLFVRASGHVHMVCRAAH